MSKFGDAMRAKMQEEERIRNKGTLLDLAKELEARGEVPMEEAFTTLWYRIIAKMNNATREEIHEYAEYRYRK